jgi:hypothetical protein
MGKIKDQVRQEFGLLPFMLGKLVGGALAVVGFPGMIIILTRRTHPTISDIWPYALMGVAGIVLFVFSSRWLSRSEKISRDETPTLKDKIKINIISWAIFLIFIGLFILMTYIMAA